MALRQTSAERSGSWGAAAGGGAAAGACRAGCGPIVAVPRCSLSTLDRAVLIAVWSTYIFVGSASKDGRLVHFMGDTDREYQARVPGYPGVGFGPLGRVQPRILSPSDGTRGVQR
jgi:hypothetical protein